MINFEEEVARFQPSLDITESVIQDLNRGYRKNAKDPAGAAASGK